MFGEDSQINSESRAYIYILTLLKYKSFSKGQFFYRHTLHMKNKLNDCYSTFYCFIDTTNYKNPEWFLPF